MTDERLAEIRREAGHARATVTPPGDSWLRGYAEDVTDLLAEVDRLRGRVEELEKQLARACFVSNKQPTEAMFAHAKRLSEERGWKDIVP